MSAESTERHRQNILALNRNTSNYRRSKRWEWRMIHLPYEPEGETAMREALEDGWEPFAVSSWPHVTMHLRLDLRDERNNPS